MAEAPAEGTPEFYEWRLVQWRLRASALVAEIEAFEAEHPEVEFPDDPVCLANHTLLIDNLPHVITERKKTKS